MPGYETDKVLHIVSPYCQGFGVDFGCEVNPVPNARVLVDGQSVVWDQFQATHEVHIRDINQGFGANEDGGAWVDGRFDFAYSSHLLEHVVHPVEFLTTCARIVKPGGHVVMVMPHEDWYWPNGHPDCNPDHRWWHLNPRKVVKWLQYVSTIYPLGIEHISEHGWIEENWSFVVVARRYADSADVVDKYVLTPDWSLVTSA